ncbi:valine--tRNA ligase [Christensenellaceae bacterium]|nr:valine--tRNA ligase [Christensenellaceae bacterium]BDF61295.1 valine--tRNA ligase [Christensenellaceae bacterium]
MTKELSTTYDPKQTETKLYEKWMEKGYFHAVIDPDKKPFTIVIPPPNITGQLHMGHALDNMLQDAIIRTKRMQGYSALWMPGTDHASIATEVKIVDALREEGISKEELGRDGFLERAWEWKAKYGGRIVEQLKKLGSSLDWQRERFTMDEGCNRAVREVFVRLYEKGLIYQGSRIINWCPDCMTALSDAEVEYEEQASHLWYMRYRAEDGGEGIVVATTRPETMLGDTAVAVNPADERYKDLIGKNVILPLLDKPIPVVADEYVDMEFGTGAVKITPAHDPNDYEVGVRHDLPIVRVMNDDGTMADNAGKYAGLDRNEARRQIVADLEQLGAMVKIEDYTHNVGHCYRCHTVIEPIISKQWFVKMKGLAEPAIKAVEEGRIKFVPERFSKIYFNWLYNIRDWCISRQLWWGHRIPAYTCKKCGKLVVALDMPDVCPDCGGMEFVQEEDVLDTWFSSGLWPFSTLGWPEQTSELEYFYPTDVLVTGYDIIFFWVARMIMFGLEIMGEIPFHTVDIHGIVRDSEGRKMSKSLNNGIDPLEVIDKYGADALRFSLAMGVSPGNDMRFYWEKVEAARNFANKVWNASRFVMMNIKGEVQPVDERKLDIADQWILGKLNDAIRECTDNMEKYDLGLAAQKIYDFAWSEFCDWYIEMAKPRLYGEDEDVKAATISVLVYVLKNTLKLLHPFMPFITEEIYTNLPDADETIMLSAWPAVEFESGQQQAEMMNGVMDMIRSIRNVRAEMNVPPSVRVKLTILTKHGDAIGACAEYLKKLAYASEVQVITEKTQIPENSVSAVCAVGEAFMPLAELIDIEKEIQRLAKEAEKNEGEIKRAQGKLANKGFTDKAPAHVVEEERSKLNTYIEMRDKLKERLAFLKDMK